MEKTINLNCFVVPNHAVANVKNFLCPSTMLRKLDILGIKPNKDDKFIQVWIHDVEHDEDNCTDHGYANEVADMLGITDRYDTFAPSYLPAALFVGVKEGDTKTWTKGDVTINMKFEQLPYRYRNHGPIEKAVAFVQL